MIMMHWWDLCKHGIIVYCGPGICSFTRGLFHYHDVVRLRYGLHPMFPTGCHNYSMSSFQPWWRHQMETFSALLALCAGNSPVSGEFPSQRPVTQSFDVFFDLCPNRQLSKQSWGWWFDTLYRAHYNVIVMQWFEKIVVEVRIWMSKCIP